MEIKKRKINKQTKKYILNISVMVIVSIITIFFMLKDDPSKVINSLANCNVLYLLLAIVIMLSFYLVEAII